MKRDDDHDRLRGMERRIRRRQARRIQIVLALVAIAVVLFLATSCAVSGDPQPTTNPGVTVELLFTKDSCRVYRFWDTGYARYFVTCPGGSTTTDESHPSGKTTINVPVVIPTVGGAVR